MIQINRNGLLLILILTIISSLVSAYSETKKKEYTMKSYHKENGVTCELCHKVKEPKSAASAKSCTWCHGDPELLIEFTKHLEPNPHNSPHWGSDLECTKCHREHSKSVIHCNECHDFKFTIK